MSGAKAMDMIVATRNVVAAKDRLTAWLRAEVWPLWLEPGIRAMWRMIDGAPRGLRLERLDPEGKSLAAACPASSLDHIACALVEVSASPTAGT